MHFTKGYNLNKISLLEFEIVSRDLGALKAKLSIRCGRCSVLFALAHLRCLHFYSSIAG
jgi:hypothetical protein